jgi:hypothetical protein
MGPPRATRLEDVRRGPEQASGGACKVWSREEILVMGWVEAAMSDATGCRRSARGQAGGEQVGEKGDGMEAVRHCALSKFRSRGRKVGVGWMAGMVWL